MVDPNTPIRDIVVPIVEVRKTVGNEDEFIRLLGTGFYLAENNVFLTASHVVRGVKNFAALFVFNGHWHSRGFSKCVMHPTEDIVALWAAGSAPLAASWLKIDAYEQHASGQYELWGYPEDVLYDAAVKKADGTAYQNPDLIYTKGYIRRRVSFEMPGVKGANLFELSEVAGSGCSGGPMITRRGNEWYVSGIYLGERRTQLGDGPIRELAYALRISAVRAWLIAQGIN
jgi:hypothetical protein